MPIYIFKNPNREEYVEVHQKMTDEHVFIDDAGLEWERVWTAPTTSIGLNTDPDSSSQFVNKTKGWSVGDMWDYSKEMSDKRKSKRGDDHVERAYNRKTAEEKKRKRNLQKKIESHRASKSIRKK